MMTSKEYLTASGDLSGEVASLLKKHGLKSGTVEDV